MWSLPRLTAPPHYRFFIVLYGSCCTVFFCPLPPAHTCFTCGSLPPPPLFLCNYDALPSYTPSLPLRAHASFSPYLIVRHTVTDTIFSLLHRHYLCFGPSPFTVCHTYTLFSFSLPTAHTAPPYLLQFLYTAQLRTLRRSLILLPVVTLPFVGADTHTLFTHTCRIPLRTHYLPYSLIRIYVPA